MPRLPILAILALLSWSLRPVQGPPLRRFAYRCPAYAKGLRSGGNLGLRVQSKGSPFDGSRHLAQDVCLPAGTEVRSLAGGIVRRSDSSPTWTDAAKEVHWNLGNVIVVEHAPEPAIEDLGLVCWLYVHL